MEDFFRLLMDALFCHPLEFTKSSLLPIIVQAALASLALELENPLTAVLHFIRDFLGYAVGHVPSSMESEVHVEMQTAIRAMIGAHGSTMCSLIMSGMIFTFPPDCVMDGAGALMTTAALALLALELENPLTAVLHVKRTQDPAFHLLSEIWHV